MYFFQRRAIDSRFQKPETTGFWFLDSGFCRYACGMHIDVLTLFPAMFEGPLTESIIARAREKGLIDIRFHDLRGHGLGQYRQVDDSPYGGGVGMVMRADVVVPAIEVLMKGTEGTEGTDRTEVKKTSVPSVPSASSVPFVSPHRILFSAAGKTLTQERVEELAMKPWLLLLCGHYEGVDQRVVEGGWIDEEISIGDYVLTGGELPAMVLIDAVARQIPGVLGKEESAQEESFSSVTDRKREYPHYTRPEEFRGLKVPDVLLSGNHAEIAKWRRESLRS